MNGQGVVEKRRSVFQHPEATVPGGVYLCQVSESVSCGACCGLYNRADASRETLLKILSFRTREFQEIPRAADAIEAFRLRMEHLESDPGIYPDFYRCPFLGLVGKQRSRVGCLLHPLSDGNRGIDFRGLSFYGGLACREYFCPPCRNLSADRKEIVRAVCTDWYLYGLVITDAAFLDAVCSEVDRRLGRNLHLKEIQENSGAAKAMKFFFDLRQSWSFRAVGWKGPGTYFFKDATYPPIPIEYEKLGCAVSRHDALFQALGSGFKSREALETAEVILESSFSRLTKCLWAPTSDPLSC